jgi:hypothetical protein
MLNDLDYKVWFYIAVEAKPRDCTIPSGHYAEGATYRYNRTQVRLQPGQTIYRVAIVQVMCDDGYYLENPANVSEEYKSFGVCAPHPTFVWILYPPRCLLVEVDIRDNGKTVLSARRWL